VWLSGDQGRGDDLADIRSLRVVAHQVIAATGFRPDHSIAAELRLALEPALESAAALGRSGRVRRQPDGARSSGHHPSPAPGRHGNARLRHGGGLECSELLRRARAVLSRRS
jgi:hypothetical protein